MRCKVPSGAGWRPGTRTFWAYTSRAVQAWMLVPYSDEIWWVHYGVRCVLLSRYTCALRGKVHCKSKRSCSELITFIYPVFETFLSWWIEMFQTNVAIITSKPKKILDQHFMLSTEQQCYHDFPLANSFLQFANKSPKIRDKSALYCFVWTVQRRDQRADIWKISSKLNICSCWRWVGELCKKPIRAYTHWEKGEVEKEKLKSTRAAANQKM